MKVRRTVPLILAGITIILIGSCASVGQFMPIAPDENVIGTIQTTFAARDSWFSKNEIINTQAYIKLLEAAAQKYPGTIDVRDIVWVTGIPIGPRDMEVSAAAKVIRIGQNETRN